MQSLQTKQKFAISVGAIAIVFAVGVIVSLSTLNTIGADNETGITPSSKMPVLGSNEPEMVVSPEGDSPSIGMPVLSSNEPEMVVSAN